MPKSIKIYKEGSINSDRVKIAVYNRIDFELPEKHWEIIDQAFADCWNKEIGRGNWVYKHQIENYIAKELKKKRILIDYIRIEKIVKIINDYIIMIGGYLDTP